MLQSVKLIVPVIETVSHVPGGVSIVYVADDPSISELSGVPEIMILFPTIEELIPGGSPVTVALC